LIFSNGRNNPKHDDILNDLRTKRQNMQKQQFRILCDAINRVFMCEDPEVVLEDLNILYTPNNGELSIEALLKIIKWFFIEQDIRYWLYSGRAMLMEGIRSVCDEQ
jgi:hypothetical protein